MKINIISFIFCLFLVKTTAQTNKQNYTEKNGFVAVEAEHFVSQTADTIRRWYVISEKSTPAVLPDGDGNHAATASGKAYLEILPDTRRTHDDSLKQGVNFTDKAGAVAVLTYNDTGKYYVWVRAFSTGSEDNGIHVGIDNQWVESGKRMQWCDGKNKWTWDSKQRTPKNHCGEPERIFLEVKTKGWHNVTIDGLKVQYASTQKLRNTTPLPLPLIQSLLSGGLHLSQNLTVFEKEKTSSPTLPFCENMIYSLAQKPTIPWAAAVT